MSSEQGFQLAAIILYLLVMVGIGFYAYRKTKTGTDFILAGRDLKPGVAALSAGASDMSGWLLMGLPGALYVSGLIESWIAIGLTVGAWVNWFVVAPRLRAYTEIAGDAITVPSYLGNRFRDRTNILRIVSSLIILVFFTFYVGSMLAASGKFFQSSFGWPYLTGLLVIGVITVGYTLFGGFLGVSLTDVAQGLLMFAALIAVPIIATTQLGGPGRVIQLIHEADLASGGHHLSFTGGGLTGATWLVIISGLGWGLGYFGQPHILSRFIALRSPQDAPTARRIGIGWMALCMLGAIITGLVGVAWFQNLGTPLSKADSETVFLQLSQILFHPFVAGLVLAAVLAAIMSTMSSQLIVCSSALAEDMLGLRSVKLTEKQLLWFGRGGVVLVAIVAALLSLDPESQVLELVSFAWGGFGSAFGPLIILGLFWKRVTSAGAIAGMITGAVVAFVWGQVPAIKEAFNLYEIIPGFILGTIVTVVVSLFTKQTNPDVDAEFAEVARMIGREGDVPTAPGSVPVE